MDALDRLYHELVDCIRRQRPADLLKPLTVTEVHEQWVPYRRVRDALGFRSNEDYQAALSRMLSGERGYLVGDGDLQSDLREGLQEVVADIRRYHAYPGARVWLNPETIPPPGDMRYAPPEVRERAERVGEVGDADVKLADAHRVAPHCDDPIDSEASAAPDPAVSEDANAPSGTHSGKANSDAVSPTASAGTSACPQCAEQVPQHAAFCPFCGFLVSGECGSCGAPMEPAWRYCAACGKPRG